MSRYYNSDPELSQISEEDKAIRDRIVALISKYTQDMENYYGYRSNYGASEDDYEDIAEDIMIEFKLGEVKG